jgi:hypothetical protein
MFEDCKNPQAPEKPHPRYTTKAEKRARIERLFPLVVAGARRSEIMQFCATKTDWGCAERTIDYYIAAANELLEAESRTHRELEVGRALRRLHILYARSVAVEDLPTALAVQREINALLGLRAPTWFAIADERQQEYSELEAVEAKRLAILMRNTYDVPALPAPGLEQSGTH